MGVATAFASQHPALALNILTDAFTAVEITAEIPSNRPASTVFTQDGSTSHADTIIQHPLVIDTGQYDGEGFASFTQLKAKGDLFGTAARFGRTNAQFSDVHTPTGGPIGTDDEMTLVFTFDGSATGHANSADTPLVDPFAGASLAVLKYTQNEGQTLLGAEVVEFNTATPPNSAFQYTIDYGGPAMFTVPFTYGETFSLAAVLLVSSYLSNDTFNRVIDRVEIDFFSTAELVAIVNEDNPSMTLVSESGIDYAPLITDEFPPIPEPTTLALAGLGLSFFSMKRRTR